jgi:hypothetical protein
MRNIIQIIKEEISKIYEDNKGTLNDIKAVDKEIKSDNMGNNIYVLNNQLFLNNSYESHLNPLAYIVALFANRTNLPKDSIVLNENQKIKITDIYSFVPNESDIRTFLEFKKQFPEYNPVKEKFFLIEILDNKNYTKTISNYIINQDSAKILSKNITKYNQKISSILLNNIKDLLQKYDTENIKDNINDIEDTIEATPQKQNNNDEEKYETLNPNIKKDRKNIGKVLLTKFDKYWGKFAPKNFLIYDNSQYKPFDIPKYRLADKNRVKSKQHTFYNTDFNETPTFYHFFDDNQKPIFIDNYSGKEDHVYGVLFKAYPLTKKEYTNKIIYNFNFLFTLIIETNNDGKLEYYNYTPINTIENYPPFQISSLKDFIAVNKNILNIIKNITNRILNNKMSSRSE